tara:strand:+ start:399 stop:554 length:156 start_codon:yes stop_codon:yes gene_type:complete
MTDQEILDALKSMRSQVGKNWRPIEDVIEALEDRLAVQDWACGGPDSERLI